MGRQSNPARLSVGTQAGEPRGLARLGGWSMDGLLHGLDEGDPELCREKSQLALNSSPQTSRRFWRPHLYAPDSLIQDLPGTTVRACDLASG